MKFTIDIPETTVMRYEVEAENEDQAVTLALESDGDFIEAPYPVETILDLDCIRARTEPFQGPLNLVEYHSGLLKCHRRIEV